MTESVITDKHVAGVLSRAVWVINPVLDVLSTVDPLGLKDRTRDDHESSDSVVDRALDALAWVLNTADVPGTKAWDEMNLDQRTRWWVRRVGALNNLVVAYPGVFGALVQRLPLQDALGFGNQAIVLVAVAREHGVVDQHDQVRMLADVLTHRTIPAGPALDTAQIDGDEDEHRSWTPFALAKALWRIARILRAIDSELDRRPQPAKLFRYVGMLPVVGIVADYFGEFGALSRAAKAGRTWIESNVGQPGGK
jgi:hypothetical protein